MTGPRWVCALCGAAHGRRECGIATWHIGTCDMCGVKTEVTEPRDFGGLRSGWRESAGDDRRR